jgi:ADP-heptose:LPS heptosyltransferase
MARVLVIRFSALGDVAMTIPVLYSVANRYPEDEFVFLTKETLQPLFVNKPDNLEIFPVDTKGKHKGAGGMLKLLRELREKEIEQVIDLHLVLRSIGIDCYFKLKEKKVAAINKGKKEKNRLTRKHNKTLTPLKSSIERYQQVFEDLGYDASLDFTSLFTDKDKKDETWIGIAPFAKHPGKIYPFGQMEKVIQLLNEKPDIRIFLFGGKDDGSLLDFWAGKYERVESRAGYLSFPEELSLINNLNVMLSMDSANMHLASLVNTPVVSIWGATHPHAGFYGYKQDIRNAVQADLKCRPCSVYGNKRCCNGSYDCLNRIEPESIVEKIMNYETRFSPSRS